MMKAISSIIGTMLMLIITLALVGFTYTFISGVFTGKTSTAFSVLDAYQDTVTISNQGTEEIKEIEGTVAGNQINLLVSPSPVPPGQTATVKLANPLPLGTYSIRLCTSSTCNTAILTIIEKLKQIITSPATFFVPSVLAAGEGGILFRNSTGSDLAIITDDGKMGIGTTGPNVQFHIDRSTDTSANAKISADATSMTSASVARLDILVGDDNSGTLGGDPFINFNVGGGDGYSIGVDNSDADKFKISKGSALGTNDRLTIDTNGNVGIGTPSPSALLGVEGGVFVGKPGTISLAGGATNIQDVSWTNAGKRLYAQDGIRTDGDIIVETGNVGIGTTAPVNKLEVAGRITGITGTGVTATGGVTGLNLWGNWTGNSALPSSDAGVDYGLTISNGAAGATYPTNRYSGITFAVGNGADGHAYNYAGIYGFSTGTVSGAKGGMTFGVKTSTSTNTAMTAAMTINDAGSVGIGTTAPGSRLEVENTGSANDVLLLEDSSGLCEAQPTTTGLTWSCSSDARLKSNIRNASAVLGYIAGIPLKDYTVIKTGENATGPIAQELLAGYKELVREGDDGYYQVSELSQWALAKAIQELTKENKELKARLAFLEQKAN